MQFETRIINGKPSIFYTNEAPKTTRLKKQQYKTKDKLATKAINDSLEISGETDHVKLSPRSLKSTGVQTQLMSKQQQSLKSGAASKKSSTNVSNKINTSKTSNGVSLSPNQLMSIISAIQSDGAQIIIDDNGRIKLAEQKSNSNPDLKDKRDTSKNRSNNKKQSNSDDERYNNNNNNNDYDDNNVHNNRSQKSNKKVERLRLNDDYENDEVTVVKKPNIVTYDDDGVQPVAVINEAKPKLASTKYYVKEKPELAPSNGAPLPAAAAATTNNISLIEKKKLQWQQDMKTAEKLMQQEVYDRDKLNQYNVNKANNAEILSNSRASVIPRTGHTPEPPKYSMSLAEKKRLQWQKEKEELNNSYRGNKSRFRSYYDEYNLRSSRDESMQIGNNMQKSLSLNNLNHDIDNRPYTTTNNNTRTISDENTQILSRLNIDQDQKISLIEKKKLKWANELNDAENVWNPFGKPGAGAPNHAAQIEQAKTRVIDHYDQRHPQQQQELTKKQMDLLAERSSSFHDQTKVPAAMRTSLLFGDVMFDDDVKRTKEIERKKWLAELDAQRRDKMFEKEYNKEKDKINDLKKDIEAKEQSLYEQNQSSERSKHNNNNNNEQKSFGRSLNRLLDPAQIEEMDRKRQASLQHQKDIQAQIAEKKRLQKLEDELLQLDNMKIENEAKLINLNQQQDLQKRKQLYNNDTNVSDQKLTTNELNKARNNNNNNNNNAFQSNSINNFDTAATNDDGNDVQLQLLQAEYNAALEKHRRLLTKLQRGGHDTEKLEAKFNEFRTKCQALGVNVGNPISTNKTGNKGNKNDNESSKASLKQPPPPSQQQQQQQTVKQKQQTSTQPPQNDYSDRQSRLRDESINTDESSLIKNFGTQTDQSKLKQLFNLLREDTNDLPIELNEENIKMLLKKVANKNQSNDEKKNTKMNATSTKTKTTNSKQKQAEPIEPPKKRTIPIEERPRWGYSNPQNKKAVPNSEKDPFFKERQTLKEQRRHEQLEQLKALIEASNRKTQRNHNSDHSSPDNDANSEINGQNDTRRTYQQQSRNSQMNSNRSSDTKQESIMNLLNNRNLATKTIYEEEDDNDELNDRNRHKTTNTQRRLMRHGSDENTGKNSNMGFVPFMRTDEFLDPAHATSPCPPSRESTATRRDREKARQAYFQNKKPADYGSTLENYHENQLDVDYRNKMKDPLFNKNLVTGRPTPRQEHILSQLANLKQSLIQKQKEVASSLRYDDD